MVLVLWTDKIHETYGYLLASGVTGVQPPHDTGNNNRNALLRDPDGNLVELVTKSIGGTDQARGQPRQVVGILSIQLVICLPHISTIPQHSVPGDKERGLDGHI